MNFSFSGRHMEVGESLTQNTKDAFGKLADKYRIEFLDINVVISKEKYLFITDIMVKTSCGSSCYITNSADDPKVSVEVTLQKLEQQLQRRKKSCKCGCKKVEHNSFDHPVSADEAEEDAPMIIAEVLEDLPLLSVSEASERLNEDRKVFIFENISNSAVNVVYLRNDGNIGWLDYKIKR